MASSQTASGDAHALEIYQGVLDDLSQTLSQGRYDHAPGFFNFPIQFRTQGADMVLETVEEVERGYAVLLESLRGQGMTEILMLASRARWLSPKYIEGFHVSHYLTGTTPLVPPFHNRAVLREVAGAWRVDEAESEASNAKWPIDKIKVADATNLPNARLSFPREDARTSVLDPLDVYTRFLQSYSACNMAHDFDGWAALHLFPHTVHTDAADKIIKTPDGIRPFFEMLSRIIQEHGVDRFERAPSRAEFLSADKICGYHTGTLYRGDTLIMGPIKSRMILQRVGPVWYMRSVTNAVSNEQIPWSEPEVSSTLIGLSEIQGRRLS